MPISRRALLFSAAAPLLTRPAPAEERPLFTFHNPFWLNLHSFLYVLGRAKNNTPDSKRGPVVGAITDGDSLETFVAEVATYSAGVSTKDAIFDRPLSALTKRLASVDGNGPRPDDLDPDVLKALRSAAPKYRGQLVAAACRVECRAHRRNSAARESLRRRHRIRDCPPLDEPMAARRF